MQTQRKWGIALAVLVCGVATTALPAAEQNWRQEWKKVTISPEPETMRDIPCPITPDTLRITSRSFQSQADPDYRAVEQIRVLVLDDVANAGTEPITIPERSTIFSNKEIPQARQTGDFSDELQFKFRYLTGPQKKKDWESFTKKADMKAQTTHPESKVPPGFGLARHLVLWKVSETETRTVGEGKKAKSGTRTQTRYGISTFSYGYHARTERIDPCTGKRVPISAPDTP